ncbi:MAG: FliH/SctL family protein [Caulobacteraceae bacterium]
MSQPPRKFTFDNVFDGDGFVATTAPAKPKAPVITVEMVEAAKAQGLAEGQRAVEAKVKAEAAAALADATSAIRQAMTALTALAQDHRTNSARLALAVGKAIAGAALEAFPEQPVIAALEALGREIEAQPRLIVRTGPGQAAALGASLSEAAEHAGFMGQVTVKTDANLQPAAFSFDWGEGRAAFDPNDAAARVTAALEQALAAEDAHAEPLNLEAIP